MSKQQLAWPREVNQHDATSAMLFSTTQDINVSESNGGEQTLILDRRTLTSYRGSRRKETTCGYVCKQSITEVSVLCLGEQICRFISIIGISCNRLDLSSSLIYHFFPLMEATIMFCRL